MFFKIKLRHLLLISFQGTRFGTNPYSLHPLANYIYYDSLNAWMPALKMMKKSGASPEEIVEQYVVKALRGICPKKFYIAASSGEEYHLDDLVDQEIIDFQETLCQGDTSLKTMMMGCVSGLRFKIR